MHSSECMGRLVNSATHDLRNVLAVIRESVGLAQDILQQTDSPLPRVDRLHLALQSAQEQVNHGAELAEGMGYLGQCAEYGEAIPKSLCDVSRITRDFCTMAARGGRACALELTCRSTAEPVLSPAAPLEIFRALLSIFDACVSVGGGVCLRFRPLLRQGRAVILCEVLEGDKNSDLIVAALSGHPLLRMYSPNWAEKVLTGNGKQRFILQADSVE